MEATRALKIFVSYAEEDVEHARTLVQALKVAQMSPFSFLHEEIPAGMDFRTLLQQKLREAHFVVLLWSSRAHGSEWIADEIAFAQRRGKQILPVLLDQAAQLPSSLATVQAIRGFGDKLGWELQVVEHIRVHVLARVQAITHALHQQLAWQEAQKTEEQQRELDQAALSAETADGNPAARPAMAAVKNIISETATVPNALKLGAGLAVLLVGMFGGARGLNTKTGSE